MKDLTLSRRAALLGGLALLPVACANPNQPTGAPVIVGDFGAATTRNMMIQTGALDAMAHLNGRFREAVETTVNFAFDRADLGPRARAILDRQAHFMRQFPEVRFAVVGHTDLVGSEGYNEGLGLRRARAVVAYLATKGVSPSRVTALVSEGETMPVVATSGRSRTNRRAVTQVGGFLDGHANLVDGKYMNVAYRQYVGYGANADTGEGIAASTAAGSFNGGGE